MSTKKEMVNTTCVPADKVEDVSGLKSALQKERENNKNLAATKRQLEEQYGGIDPEEYQRLKELEAQEEERKAEKKGEWDKLLNGRTNS
jgi:hypothetical protein